jgi:hypothetical protein
VANLQFPVLLFSDVALLFTIGILMLLVTVELCYSGYGRLNLAINPKKLMNVTMAVLALFLATLTIQVLINLGYL